MRPGLSNYGTGTRVEPAERYEGQWLWIICPLSRVEKRKEVSFVWNMRVPWQEDPLEHERVFRICRVSTAHEGSRGWGYVWSPLISSHNSESNRMNVQIIILKTIAAVREDRMRGGRNKFGSYYKRDRAQRMQRMQSRVGPGGTHFSNSLQCPWSLRLFCFILDQSNQTCTGPLVGAGSGTGSAFFPTQQSPMDAHVTSR